MIYIQYTALPFLMNLINPTPPQKKYCDADNSLCNLLVCTLVNGNLTDLQCTVEEGEACPAGVELYIIRLEMNCRLPCLQGLHHSGHQLSKDTQNGRG